MRRILLVLCATAALTACGGDGDGGKPTPAVTPTPTYELPARHVRVFEKPLNNKPVKVGMLEVTAMAIRTGMPYLVGTHAEYEAKGGQFIRVRVQVNNVDRDVQDFKAGEQLLITTDGRTYKPNIDAMSIKRQGMSVTLGSGVLLEMDLLYDVPVEAKPKAMRFVAKTTTLVAGIETGVKQVDVPLPPSSQ